jgi:aspartate ammonia-lyase
MSSETRKAAHNFINSRLPHYPAFHQSFLQVKLAAANTNLELGYLSKEKGQLICQAIQELLPSSHKLQSPIDPLQGGAGTSTNMFFNELISEKCETIDPSISIDPIEDVNLHQSTNDTYPTALYIAILSELNQLEDATNQLLLALQNKEKEFQSILKMGRTQLIPAVPTTMGKSFSAFADMIARDRWRIFKGTERIRQTNLGGTAIGTGITAPKSYIFRVTKELQRITGLPLSRSENLVDATQNHDMVSEVFGFLKTYSLNLEKVVSDIRKMIMLGELTADKMQLGSTIMPGKSNPVLFEHISIICKKVIGNELTASLSISQGELELNTFLPLVSYTILESLHILKEGTLLLAQTGLDTLSANQDICQQSLYTSPSIVTLFIPEVGFNLASKIGSLMQNSGLTVFEAAAKLDVLSEEVILKKLTPENVLKLGHE